MCAPERSTASPLHRSAHTSCYSRQREVYRGIQEGIVLLEYDSRHAADDDLDPAHTINAAARTVGIFGAKTHALDRRSKLVQTSLKLSLYVNPLVGAEVTL